MIVLISIAMGLSLKMF